MVKAEHFKAKEAQLSLDSSFQLQYNSPQLFLVIEDSCDP